METAIIKLNLIYSYDWNEYTVMVYVNGVYNEMKSYFTDCYSDAIDTMKAMEIHYNEMGSKVTANNRVKRNHNY